MNMKKTTVLAVLATLFVAITPAVAESEKERDLQAIGPTAPSADFCAKAGNDCYLCMASACAMRGNACVPTCSVNDPTCYSRQSFPGQSLNQICRAHSGNLRGSGNTGTGSDRQNNGGGSTVNVGNQGMTNTPPATGGTTNTWVGNQDMMNIPPSTGTIRCPSGTLGMYDEETKKYECIQNPCQAGYKYQWFREGREWACVPYQVIGQPAGYEGLYDSPDDNNGPGWGGRPSWQTKSGNPSSMLRQGNAGGGTVNVGNQGTAPSTGGTTGGTTNTWVGNQDMMDLPPSTGSTRCAVGQLGVYDPVAKKYSCIQNPCAAGEKYQWGGFRNPGWACVPYTPNGTPVGGSTNNNRPNGGNKDKDKNKNKNRNGNPGLFP